MNELENLIITMGLTAIRAVLKNPSHAAAVQAQLVGIANDIYAAYGLTPPATES